MQTVEIKERIKVRADFTAGGKIVPRLFRRNEHHIFRVKKINAAWEDKEANGKLLYFSVSVEESDDIFQLCYRESERSWWIDSIIIG